MNNLVKRASRMWWYIVSMIMRPLVPIRKNRIIMWAYSFRKYTCHPQHFTEYLLKEHPDDFEIIWVFENPKKQLLDPRIRCVKYPSFEYLWCLYSSKFVISNSRCKKYLNFFKRKAKQEYIQTWHDSGVALKRIEKDVMSSLKNYAKEAQLDSANCTLMLSGSKFQTKLIKSSFWYEGEILEKGLPRNDCFKNANRLRVEEKIKSYYGLDPDKKVLLYAPTFRNNATENKVFINDWLELINNLNGISVLVRLHPNSIGKVDMNRLLSHPNVKDATAYNDMQELLLAADYLITDYSSCMIDMAILKKPCFLYTADIDTYDRGYYFNLRSLPFSVSTSMVELINDIRTFNMDEYTSKINSFLSEKVGLYPIGESCESLYNWIKNKL